MAMTDRELIERVLEGRQEDFAELVRRHHARVLALCASMLHDRAAADDAAQEVFLKAYESLGDFRADSAFSTWLHRVAVNKCLDARRAESRRRSDSLEALTESEDARLKWLLADPRDDRAHFIEDADLVARTLARLDEDHRIVLTLRELQGFTYEELAETLDCTVDAIKARLQRARRAFRDMLGHISPPDGV
jgi:RNA polymerase sigma-70 factor (ECF subfamily)